MGEYLSLLEGLQIRIEGPMNLRFLSQPSVAIFFAFRDGRLDAIKDQAPFISSVFSRPEARCETILSGWRSVGKVFAAATLLDLVFQYLVFGELRYLGALVAGLILAVIPYLLLRGPVNRFFRAGNKKRQQ